MVETDKNVPWIIKYRPKDISDIVGHSKQAQDLLNYVRNFDKQRKKAIILYGPSGCGKTALVYALAQELNYELLEINASDVRNKDAILNTLGPASRQASLFGSSKIILVDEADSLSGTKDRGGPGAIADIIKNTIYPIILTVDDPWSDKLKSIRRYSALIELRKLDSNSICKYLKKILVSEGIIYEDKAINRLSNFVDGDLRAGINDLQMLASCGRIYDADLKLWKREKEESLFDALRLIFKSFDCNSAIDIVDDLNEDLKLLGYWLEENIPYEYFKSGERYLAYKSLSDYDVFASRVIRWQYWRFMYYAKMLMIMGVQQAKDGVNPRPVVHKKPQILQKIFIRAAKRKKYEGLGKQIGPILHSSSKRLIKDFFPYYKFIGENNPEMFAKLNAFLDLEIK